MYGVYIVCVGVYIVCVCDLLTSYCKSFSYNNIPLFCYGDSLYDSCGCNNKLCTLKQIVHCISLWPKTVQQWSLALYGMHSRSVITCMGVVPPLW